MEQVFISDLHLSPQRPGVTERLLHFLERLRGRQAKLYILGDLFDAWIGDDDTTAPIPEILTALRETVDAGVEILFIPGNRDFLIGQGFADASGCTLLEDPTLIDLQGTPTLLMHGDLLCTDDVEYQSARQMLRSPAFIAGLLAKSIPERLAIAAEYRRRSGEAVSLKAADIMDVNQQAVEERMREHRARLLIHGHTHRPGEHQFELDGQTVRRLVLGEWHPQDASCLRINEQLQFSVEPV